MFPEFTENFIEKETVFATTCHKISSLRVATQRWGSAVITGTLTSGSEARGAAGGFCGEQGDTKATAVVDEDANCCLHLYPPHGRLGQRRAPQGQADAAPFPAASPVQPANQRQIPPETNSSWKSWGQGPKGGRSQPRARGGTSHARRGSVGRFSSRTAPPVRALGVSHPGVPSR